jgi:hypothetical protein
MQDSFNAHFGNGATFAAVAAVVAEAVVWESHAANVVS